MRENLVGRMGKALGRVIGAAVTYVAFSETVNFLQKDGMPKAKKVVRKSIDKVKEVINK